MATSKNTEKDAAKAAEAAEKEAAKAAEAAEKEVAKAAEKEAAKAAKAAEAAEKETAKAAEEAEKEEAKAAKAAEAAEAAKRMEAMAAEQTAMAAEEPKVTEEGMHDPDTADVLKAHAQDVPRATAQDAPTGIPMGAVNDSAPNATVNRFSGVYPNNTYPLVNGKLDEVQEQLKQARDEKARTKRVSSAVALAPHPPLASKYTTNDHALRRVPPVVSTATRVLRTTTRVALAVGNTLIPVASTTDILVGDLVTLSRGLPAQESVTVTVVDTDATGPRVQIGAPGLKYAHASGATVHEYVA